MICRIALTGPESTGKTTLARELALHYHTLWVPEYAREYIGKLNRSYTLADLEKIALRQIACEGEASEKANQLLFCDSDLFVLKVWAENAFGKCPAWINSLIQSKPYTLHLLCAPDLPWEPDPQREHPNHRWELYEKYKQALAEAGVGFVEITGIGDSRRKAAIEVCEQLMRKQKTFIT